MLDALTNPWTWVVLLAGLLVYQTLTGRRPGRSRPTLRPVTRVTTGPRQPDELEDDPLPATKGATFTKGDVRRGATILQQQAVEAGRSLSVAEAEALALEMLQEGLG